MRHTRQLDMRAIRSQPSSLLLVDPASTADASRWPRSKLRSCGWRAPGSPLPSPMDRARPYGLDVDWRPRSPTSVLKSNMVLMVGNNVDADRATHLEGPVVEVPRQPHAARADRTEAAPQRRSRDLRSLLHGAVVVVTDPRRPAARPAGCLRNRQSRGGRATLVPTHTSWAHRRPVARQCRTPRSIDEAAVACSVARLQA